MDKKQCSKCGESKDLDCFAQRKDTKDGYRGMCEVCQKAQQAEYRKKNKKKIQAKARSDYLKNREEKLRKDKIYYQKNRQYVLNRQKNYYINNKEKIAEKDKKYQKKNKKKIQKRVQAYNDRPEVKKWRSEYNKAYGEANKESIKEVSKAYRTREKKRIMEQKKIYVNKRIKSDPLFRLNRNYRRSCHRALQSIGHKKNNRSLKLLGLETWQELAKHLQSQFYDHPETGEEMTFDNHGYYGWHIDHIIPISTATTEEEMIKLCHHTNLQPMWAEENRAKSNKILDK